MVFCKKFHSIQKHRPDQEVYTFFENILDFFGMIPCSPDHTSIKLQWFQTIGLPGTFQLSQFLISGETATCL